jgi:antitoxin ParD1/3/4
MPTRHVIVSDQQFAFLDQLVSEGRYPTVSDAMRAALRLLERDEATWTDLRLGVLHGYDQVLQGTLAPGSGGEAVMRAFDRAMARAGT